MKKATMKRTGILLLILVLCAALLSACQQQTEPAAPTEVPAETEAPVEEATEVPTEEPTAEPTEEPTEAPAEEASEVPAAEPTEAPAEDTGAGNDLLAQIRERGTLIIAMEGNWSPWTYHDENDQLTGFDVEIGALIAEGLGVTPVYKEAAWDSLLAGVDSGRFDIVCNGVSYTSERAEKYAFSEPYVYTEIVLVVAADNEDIKDFPDLKGKKTSNSPGSTFAARAEAEGAEVVYVDTLGETMAMLEQGRVDATINAKGSVEDYLSEHPDAKIKIVQTIPGEAVAYPVKLGPESDTLVAEINRILQDARESGKLSELSIKYFGVDLTNPQ